MTDGICCHHKHLDDQTRVLFGIPFYTASSGHRFLGQLVPVGEAAVYSVFVRCCMVVTFGCWVLWAERCLLFWQVPSCYLFLLPLVPVSYTHLTLPTSLRV